MSKQRGKPPTGPRDPDPNVTAKSILDRIIRKTEGEPEPEPPKQKDPAAVARGRKGGSKGGNARSEKLTPKQRSQIAKKAAASRWSRS